MCLHVVFREREAQKKLEKEKALEERLMKNRQAALARFSATVKSMNYAQQQRLRTKLELERKKREEQQQRLMQDLTNKSRHEKLATVRVSPSIYNPCSLTADVRIRWPKLSLDFALRSWKGSKTGRKWIRRSRQRLFVGKSRSRIPRPSHRLLADLLQDQKSSVHSRYDILPRPIRRIIIDRILQENWATWSSWTCHSTTSPNSPCPFEISSTCKSWFSATTRSLCCLLLTRWLASEYVATIASTPSFIN